MLSRKEDILLASFKKRDRERVCEVRGINHFTNSPEIDYFISLGFCLDL